MTCWHTDYYERLGGSWQAVWLQATAISSPTVQDELKRVDARAAHALFFF
jgi:hypothetical protein